MTSTSDNELGVRREQGQDGLLALSQIALDSTAQGICVYDADNRIVLFNRRYIELFEMSAEMVRIGTPIAR